MLNLLIMPLRHERPDLWHQHLGVSHNLLQILGLLPVKCGHSKGTMDKDNSDQESSMEDEEILNIRADMVDESGRSPDVVPESGDTQQSMPVNADDVKRVLFGSHKALIEDIQIALLSSENHVKWSNYKCSEFYDFALSSTAAIYRAMTIHDLNIVINVL